MLWAAVLGTAPVGGVNEPGQSFVLQDYIWVPVSVRSVPTAVECHFNITGGKPTVHVELLSEHDFQLFSRRRDYDALALAEGTLSGGFRRMVETPGRYRVLVRNDPGALPVIMSLTVGTEVDPAPASISLGVAPRRKYAAIGLSLVAFLGTVWWSGSRLLRAWHSRRL